MPIPTENVGALPRPSKLQAAIADYDAGNITHEELTRDVAFQKIEERVKGTAMAAKQLGIN